QAQVASAQTQVQAAQLALNQTTLTAPTSGVVISLSGVPGESVAGGGSGATAQAPGSLAPQPASSSATGSGGSSGFMVIDGTSSYVLANGQQVSTEVVTGIVGDSYTEIKAGLSEGDKVVLPALRTTGTSTTNSNNLLRGGGFGGGGIRSGGG